MRILNDAGAARDQLTDIEAGLAADKISMTSRPLTLPGAAAGAVRVGGVGHHMRRGLAGLVWAGVCAGGDDDLDVAVAVRAMAGLPCGPRRVAAGVSWLVSLRYRGIQETFRITPVARLAARVPYIDCGPRMAASGRRVLSGAGGLANVAWACICVRSVVFTRLVGEGSRVPGRAGRHPRPVKPHCAQPRFSSYPACGHRCAPDHDCGSGGAGRCWRGTFAGQEAARGERAEPAPGVSGSAGTL